MRATALRRRATVAFAAAVALGAGGVLVAAPAQAASIDAKCELPGFDTIVDFTWNADVTYSPASPKAGDSVAITVKLPEGYLNGPAVPLKPGDLKYTVTLDVGGTTVEADGEMSNTSTVVPNAKLSLGPATGTYSAKEGSQKVVITKVFMDHQPSDIDTTCTPQSKPTQATIVVTGAGGGGSDPTPTPTTNSSGNNGNSGGNNKDLASTGPDEALTTLVVAVVVHADRPDVLRPPAPPAGGRLPPDPLMARTTGLFARLSAGRGLRALVATTAATALAGAGLAIGAAPAFADGASGTFSPVYCQVNAALGALRNLPRTANWSFDMSLSPANAASGATVTITVSSPQRPEQRTGSRHPCQRQPDGGGARTSRAPRSSPTSAAQHGRRATEPAAVPGGWTATATSLPRRRRLLHGHAQEALQQLASGAVQHRGADRRVRRHLRAR